MKPQTRLKMKFEEITKMQLEHCGDHFYQDHNYLIYFRITDQEEIEDVYVPIYDFIEGSKYAELIESDFLFVSGSKSGINVVNCNKLYSEIVRRTPEKINEVACYKIKGKKIL